MSRPLPRAARAVPRVAAHARRATASVAELGALGYPGGVDPITETTPDDPLGSPALAVVRGWARARGGRLLAVVVTADDAPVGLGTPDGTDPRADDRVAPWRAEVVVPPEAVLIGAVAVYADGLTERLDPHRRRTSGAPDRPAGGAGAENSASPDRSENPDDPADPDRAGRPTSPLAPGAGGARAGSTSRLEGFLEQPVDAARVPASLVPVSGWAALDDLARVEVHVDEGRPSRARQMAIPRPDVVPHHPSVHAGFSGFEHVVDLTDRTPGEQVAITVTAVDGQGVAHPLGTHVVTIDDPAVPAPTDADRVATLRARTARLAERHRPAPEGIRLLAVTHDLGLGGGQLYLQELLVRLLDGSGIQAMVISPTDGPLRDELEALGVEVHVVGPYPTDPVAYESLLHGLVHLALEFGTTHVLVNTAGALCGVDLAGRLGVPALWAIHESYAPEHYVLAAYGPGAHPSAGDRLEEALGSSAAVIFEAEETRQLYCAHGDPARFLHIGYGIPLAAVDEFRAGFDRAAHRAALGWTDDDVVLLCVGTLEPRKAQASLLRAFARVARDHPEAVLVLVGDRGDWYGEQLRTYADRLGLGDRVRIEAVSPDCYEWYAVADAFVLASDVESLPRSVLEAMAFGAPAVVADVFGLHDLIDDGDTGLLFAPRDLHALDAALRAFLARSASDRRALGERGAAHVRAEHDSRGYASVFRNLIDGFATDPSALPEAFL